MLNRMERNADSLSMLTTLSNKDLLWKGDSDWSDREFFKELSAANAAVSSYQHDLTLWRGHAKAGWSLASRLLRELPSFAVAQDVVNKETEVLPTEARNARPGWLEGMILQNSTDLDLLALLQHLGASTPLMDLTTDPYVDLYFAVAGNETNGLLLGLQAKTWAELTNGSAAYSRPWNEQTRVMADSAMSSIAYLRPPNISARIPAQRSILALGVVADEGSWAHNVGSLPVETPAESW